MIIWARAEARASEHWEVLSWLKENGCPTFWVSE